MRSFFIWKNCSKGATATEYSLLAAGIAGAVIVTLFFFGDRITNVFESSSDVMQETTDQANT